jgi:hypothetical protein
MSEEVKGWNMSEAEWARLVARATANVDVLEDGAYVGIATGADGGTDLLFYASALNKPPAWHYPFTEPSPRGNRPVAYVGRAWRDQPTGYVEFEVMLTAAAEALQADFEGGASDLDDLGFEQAMESAVRGTPADHEWLIGEYQRLVRLAQAG